MNNTFFELTPAEFKKLRRFLESPYFNTNKKLPKLALELKELNGSSVYEPQNKEILWTNVTGSKKFNNSGFNKMMSDFYAAYEKFLAYSEFEKDTHAFNVYLNRSLMLKGDYDSVGKISKNAIKSITSNFLKDEDSYLNLSRFYDDLYYHESYVNPLKFPSELEESGKCLNYSFAFAKLHNYITHYNHKHNYKFGNPESEPMIAEILGYLTDNLAEIEKFHPNIAFPYYLVMFLHNKFDKKYLKNYEDYLQKTEKKLDKEHQYYFRLYLGVMYTILAEKGDGEAWMKIFLNHKKLADSNNLTHEKYLTSKIFIAIVFEALHAGEFEWTKKFINKYSDKLMPGEKKDSINLANSRLYLYMSKYDKALNHITLVKSNAPLFYFNSKTTFCFIYLVNKDFDLLNALTDSMRKYANRNKTIPAPIKSNMLTFLKYFKKLERSIGNEFELKKLSKEIKNSNQRIPSKNLFIDKISWFLKKDFSF